MKDREAFFFKGHGPLTEDELGPIARDNIRILGKEEKVFLQGNLLTGKSEVVWNHKWKQEDTVNY